MRKEYQKPSMKALAFETSYGMMQDNTSPNGSIVNGGNSSGNGGGTGTTEAYSKQNDFIPTWEDSDKEEE